MEPNTVAIYALLSVILAFNVQHKHQIAGKYFEDFLCRLEFDSKVLAAVEKSKTDG